MLLLSSNSKLLIAAGVAGTITTAWAIANKIKGKREYNISYGVRATSDVRVTSSGEDGKYNNYAYSFMGSQGIATETDLEKIKKVLKDELFAEDNDLKDLSTNNVQNKAETLLKKLCEGNEDTKKAKKEQHCKSTDQNNK